jgi:hypothetical protein
MAASPEYKVFNPQREYIAACKHPEDAAAIVALYGYGSQIEWMGCVVWHDGKEDRRAMSHSIT